MTLSANGNGCHVSGFAGFFVGLTRYPESAEFHDEGDMPKQIMSADGWRVWAVLLCCMVCGWAHAAIGDEPYVTFRPEAKSLAIAQSGKSVALSLDSSDYPGVLRAAGDLQSDIER